MGTARAAQLIKYAIELKKAHQYSNWVSAVLERALPIKLVEDLGGKPREQVSAHAL